jgi:hypothetical protein
MAQRPRARPSKNDVGLNHQVAPILWQLPTIDKPHSKAGHGYFSWR